LLRAAGGVAMGIEISFRVAVKAQPIFAKTTIWLCLNAPKPSFVPIFTTV